FQPARGRAFDADERALVGVVVLNGVVEKAVLAHRAGAITGDDPRVGHDLRADIEAAVEIVAVDIIDVTGNFALRGLEVIQRAAVNRPQKEGAERNGDARILFHPKLLAPVAELISSDSGDAAG